jgi:hypothetical protein
MFKIGCRRGLAAALLGSVVAVAMVGPASAHAVQVSDVSGFENPEGGVFTDVFLSRQHNGSGIVRVTLFKRNAAGDPWINVDTRRARWMDGAYGGLYYQAKFPLVRGDWQCKVRARFTAPNHDPSSKIDRFAC